MDFLEVSWKVCFHLPWKESSQVFLVPGVETQRFFSPSPLQLSTVSLIPFPRVLDAVLYLMGVTVKSPSHCMTSFMLLSEHQQ